MESEILIDRKTNMRYKQKPTENAENIYITIK